MGFRGNKFTWSRLAAHPRTQRARLDRSICNDLCRTIFRSWNIDILEAFSSDHSCLSIRLSSHPPHNLSLGKTTRPLRFEAMWVRSKDCEKIIADNWNLDIENIGDKIDNCRFGLLNWSKTEFGDLDKKITALKRSITNLRKSTISQSTRTTLLHLNTQLESLLSLHDLKWKQRAKQHWLREGDRNSKYFHAMASSRQATNHISSLRDEAGSLQTDPDRIQQIIGNYFADIFTSSSPSNTDIERALHRIRPRVSVSMAEALIQPFTGEEVSRALKHMHPFKSPGPDATTRSDTLKFAIELYTTLQDNVSILRKAVFILARTLTPQPVKLSPRILRIA
ncbi:hypothetical protein DH2020_013298 [Rehmannia glutinosa]|uniref:Endonuclease/exonuclease/phosphatase domain-containing protein n=1 Tax=Rehmannia glutinosa TaxID=99300 RepID=A0ABR0X506_REHGL